ncbi:hypothetical protein [Flavobacterium luteum]|uniref:Uncharacterized protein n=1 Tax=Flavobacterium luteum TaxID=2026654 RepID=A0A7J5AD27_9FLAO|nr:hypothetical protein [Flavobacterium luteum]KAB1154939.1 hypothetical protein F6464_10970 [Flavobacterium luteum]
MKIRVLYFSFLSMFFFSCTTDREIATENIIIDPNSQLIYYWNFNTLIGTVDKVVPDYALPALNANLTYLGDGTGYMDSFTTGYSLNIRNNETEVSGLRVRNPSDTRSLVLTVPTAGYKQIVVAFATAKTSSGATTQKYSYTLDGITYINSGLNLNTYNPNVDPLSSLVTLNFSTITGVNDNPNFKIKIDFEGVNASGLTGNNRFDNITLEGVPIPLVDTSVYLFQYWNFNALPSGTLTSIAPDASLINSNSAAITYIGAGAGYMDQYTPGAALNAQNGDIDGLGLRLRNPSDTRNLLITASTVGYKNVIVKFATARSSIAGASIQNYSYSIDGINFSSALLPVTTFSPNIDPAYDIITLDFSSIIGANNNANFIVKISFSGSEASGSSGNNRIDNVTFQGNKL